MNYIKCDIRGVTPGSKELHEMLNACSCVSGINQKEPAIKVSYKGHTGDLVRLEREKNYRTTEQLYDLVIARDGFDDPPSIFIGIKLQEIKFIGGSVSFE